MAKGKSGKQEDRRRRKPVGWLHGEIKTPPFTDEGRKEAGDLLRLLQEGEQLGMPQAEPLPSSDRAAARFESVIKQHNWRIVYRVDADAVLVLEVYAKKTRKIPLEVTDRCKKRLKEYDEIAKKAAQKPAKEPTRLGAVI